MLFIIYKEHIYVTKIFLSFVRPSPFVSPAPSHQHLAWFAYVHTKVQRLQLYFHCSPPCSGVKSCLEPTSIILGIFQSEANYLLYKKNPYTKNRQLDSENIVQQNNMKRSNCGILNTINQSIHQLFFLSAWAAAGRLGRSSS